MSTEETPLKLEWRKAPFSYTWVTVEGMLLACTQSHISTYWATVLTDDDHAPFGQAGLHLEVATDCEYATVREAQLAAEALLERVRGWFAGEREMRR